MSTQSVLLLICAILVTFPLLFIAIWSFTSWLIAWLAGWPRLAVEAPLTEITGSIPTAAVDASGRAADNVAAAKSNPFVHAPEDARTNPFVLPTAVAKIAPPRPPAEAMPPEAPPMSEFVRKVHQDACKAFGTVLGPEANEAHKDHFHLDMKARRHKAICE